MKNTGHRGFTLIELLLVTAVIAIIAAIGIPGLLRSRIAANEASAIGSLRAINSSQAAFATSCGDRLYAATLVVLGTAPLAGGPAFISPDLSVAAAITKSGYEVQIVGTPVPGTEAASCNGGNLASGYRSTASPLLAGTTGVRYFWTNISGAIYTQAATFSSTNEVGAPAGDPSAIPLMR